MALADRGALLQTLVSVLLDAADATPHRGSILVCLRNETSHVVVTIDDPGSEPQPSDPDVQRRAPAWISRSVARSFGGELTVSRGPLGGRRVSLRLLAA
jgi:C4-dicarboxylate-specific signal transduction histidine kinase